MLQKIQLSLVQELLQLNLLMLLRWGVINSRKEKNDKMHTLKVKEMTIPFQRQHLRKYFIMGSQDCGNRSPLTVLEAALQAGITAFQFREKGTGALTGEEKEILGAKLRARCASYQVP